MPKGGERIVPPVGDPGPPPRGCRWPLWGDHAPTAREAEHGFCGAAVVPGRPYCAEHCARAYVPIQRKAALMSKLNGAVDFAGRGIKRRPPAWTG